MLALGRSSCPCLLAMLCAGCIGDPPHQAPVTDRGAGALELHARDARGEPADLELLPRRPTFELIHPDGIAASDDALLLLAGDPDEALLEDLRRAPLSAAQLARRIDCEVQWSTARVRVAPRAPLAADAPYTLAIASWATTLRGSPLVDDRSPIVFELRTDAQPEAGARVLRSWPADGASGIGTNLAAAVLSFDGTVTGVDTGTWIEGPQGLAVPTRIESGPCAQLAPEHAGAFCVRLAPQERLAPGALYRLVVGSEARDGHGAPVGPWRASFRTAQSRDALAPIALVSSCAIDELPVDLGCALVDDASIALRIQADEPVVAALSLGGDSRGGMAAPDGRVVLRVADLEPDAEHVLQIELRDAADNVAERMLAVRTLPPLPTLAISEVLADPLGPEPQQEFVELLNYGATAIDLLGFSLGDRTDMPGVALARSARLDPQARALLVADGYDPSATYDVAPPPGALLVRVGRALASGGLRNAGEALFLRDALGHRVSAAPASPSPRPGVCAVRVGEQMRSGEPDAFDYDADHTCTPGE